MPFLAPLRRGYFLGHRLEVGIEKQRQIHLPAHLDPGAGRLERHQSIPWHAAFTWGSRHRNGYRLSAFLRMPDAFPGGVEPEPATGKDGKMPIRQYLNGERFDPETTRLLGLAFEFTVQALHNWGVDDPPRGNRESHH